MPGFKGGCLCGSVRYESSTDPMMAAHCHCVDCRKSSGTGHCTHLVVPKEAFSISGAVKFYDRPADSGNMVSRGFCPSCGGRRMADTAAHLVDRVLPEVPMRQWVLTLTYPLRYRCA